MGTVQYYIFTFIGGVIVALILFQFRTLNDIVDHTLKNPKTKIWSRKNLTGVTAFFYSMYYTQYCIMKGVVIQEFVLVIFNATALGCLGISSWEKFQAKPPKAPDEDHGDKPD